MRRRELSFLLLLPVLAACSVPSLAQHTIYLPHYGDGGGWLVQLSVSNLSTAAVTGKLKAFDPTGQAQTLPFESGDASEISLNLPARSTVVYKTLGTSSPVKTGYLEITADSKEITAVLIFKYTTGAEASVLPCIAARRFFLFVERLGQMDTGVAVCRTSTGPVRVTLYGADGLEQASGTFPFDGDGKQAAIFASQLFNLPATFRGYLRLDSDGDFSSVGLRFGQNVLSTIPVSGDLWQAAMTLPYGGSGAYDGTAAFSVTNTGNETTSPGPLFPFRNPAVAIQASATGSGGIAVDALVQGHSNIAVRGIAQFPAFYHGEPPVKYGGYFEAYGPKSRGVAGLTDGQQAVGVYGEASGSSGVGVKGKSATGDGTVGESGGSTKSGVYGFNTNGEGYGVFGRNSSAFPTEGYLGGLHGVSGKGSSGLGSCGGYFETAGGFGAAVKGKATVPMSIGGHFEAKQLFSLALYAEGPPAGTTGYAAELRGKTKITDTKDGASIVELGPAVGGGNVSATIRGNVQVLSSASGATVIELGEGLDYAEGFDVSQPEVAPGSVLIIDAARPGKLTVSSRAYDRRVAGIVAGAKGLGSGVRLGVDQYTHSVALAGRVYCNVDASFGDVSPGDLLTTSPTPGYAMAVRDHRRAQGAILGKAMERMPKGLKGQMLVLVTLQ